MDGFPNPDFPKQSLPRPVCFFTAKRSIFILDSSKFQLLDTNPKPAPIVLETAVNICIDGLIDFSSWQSSIKKGKNRKHVF